IKRHSAAPRGCSHRPACVRFLPPSLTREEGRLYAICPRGGQARLSVLTALLVAALTQKGWHIDIRAGSVRVIVNRCLRLGRGFLALGQLSSCYLLLFSGRRAAKKCVALHLCRSTCVIKPGGYDGDAHLVTHGFIHH